MQFIFCYRVIMNRELLPITRFILLLCLLYVMVLLFILLTWYAALGGRACNGLTELFSPFFQHTTCIGLRRIFAKSQSILWPIRIPPCLVLSCRHLSHQHSKLNMLLMPYFFQDCVIVIVATVFQNVSHACQATYILFYLSPLLFIMIHLRVYNAVQVFLWWIYLFTSLGTGFWMQL